MDRETLEFNGSVFEGTVARYLQHRYPGCIILHNLELRSPYLKKTTQIDLIMINQKGVFVIEAKGWKRWIKGDYNSDHWSGQSSSSEIMNVFSPINQNFIHIRAVRNAIRTELGIEPVFFHNIVCLPNGTTLDTPCTEVVNLSMLGLLIDRLMIEEKNTLNPDEWRYNIEAVTQPGHK